MSRFLSLLVVLGMSWVDFWSFWGSEGVLGSFGGCLGWIFDSLGGVRGGLGGSWGLLGRSWDRLGPSWVVRVVLSTLWPAGARLLGRS